MLVTLLSPISKLQHTPLPPKVLQAREHALTLCSSVVFTSDSHLSLSRSLGECVTLVGSVILYPLGIPLIFGKKSHMIAQVVTNVSAMGLSHLNIHP